MRYRVMMIAYLAGSAVLYITFGLPLLLLLPLVDNFLFALTLYRVGLSTTDGLRWVRDWFFWCYSHSVIPEAHGRFLLPV